MQANTLRLLPLFAFLAGGTGWANGGGNDPYSAERYYSSPQKFIGERVKVRIFKIEPQPKLTANDLGYVWFQAHTSREGTESSKIQVRVEQEEAEKFARNFQTENRAGRVVAETFERIHRSNLVGMGVLPCTFAEGVNAQTLKLDGTETYSLEGLSSPPKPRETLSLVVKRADGKTEKIPVTSRLDTPIEVEYYLHGGILPFVLRQLLQR